MFEQAMILIQKLQKLVGEGSEVSLRIDEIIGCLVVRADWRLERNRVFYEYRMEPGFEDNLSNDAAISFVAGCLVAAYDRFKKEYKEGYSQKLHGV